MKQNEDNLSDYFFFKYSGRNKYFCLLDYTKDWKELNL